MMAFLERDGMDFEVSSVSNKLKKPGRVEALVAALLFSVFAYALYAFEAHSSGKSVLLCVIAGLTLVLSWLLYRYFGPKIKEAVPRIVFPAVLVVSGLLSVFFFPAGSVPDEPYHFYHAYEYSSALVGEDSGIIRAEDIPLFTNGEFLSPSINNSGWEYTKSHVFDSKKNGSVSLSELGNIDPKALSDVSLLSELPQVRVPAAFGISVAKLLGLNHVCLFYAGRLFSFLFSALLIAIAVAIAPVGKNITMVVSLFPMTLQLLGSYSYDSATIGFTFLTIALALRLIKEGGSVKPAELVGFVVLAALMAPCKAVYFGAALIALLIPAKRFASNRECWLFRAFVFIVPILSVLIVRASSLAGAVDSDGSDEISFYSLTMILSDPLGSYVMLCRTIESLGTFWLINIPGDSLGWFQQDTSFPDYIPMLLLLLLALSSVRSKDDEQCFSIPARLFFVVLFLVCSSGVVLSLWLTWTESTELLIQGVQGRYFIPLLPMFVLALRTRGVRASYRMGFPLVACTSTMSICGYAYIAAACAI